MIRGLKKLLADVRGATALEYGLILSLIVMILVTGATALGSGLAGQWNYVSSQVSTAVAKAIK